MGQAFDESGAVLGEATGATKREVLDQLTALYPDAVEIRIRRVGDALIAAKEKAERDIAAFDARIRKLEEDK